MPDADQHTDHRAEALRQLVEADEERCSSRGCDPSRVAQCQVEAQVHASLAIAQGQERVADELWDQNHWLEEITNQLSRAQS